MHARLVIGKRSLDLITEEKVKRKKTSDSPVKRRKRFMLLLIVAIEAMKTGHCPLLLCCFCFIFCGRGQYWNQLTCQSFSASCSLSDSLPLLFSKVKLQSISVSYLSVNIFVFYKKAKIYQQTVCLSFIKLISILFGWSKSNVWLYSHSSTKSTVRF